MEKTVTPNAVATMRKRLHFSPEKLVLSFCQMTNYNKNLLVTAFCNMTGHIQQRFSQHVQRRCKSRRQQRHVPETICAQFPGCTATLSVQIDINCLVLLSGFVFTSPPWFTQIRRFMSHLLGHVSRRKAHALPWIHFIRVNGGTKSRITGSFSVVHRFHSVSQGDEFAFRSLVLSNLRIVENTTCCFLCSLSDVWKLNWKGLPRQWKSCQEHCNCGRALQTFPCGERFEV